MSTSKFTSYQYANVRGGSWVRSRIALILAGLAGLALFYASVLAIDWYGIRHAWIEVPATFRISEALFPASYRRIVTSGRRDRFSFFATLRYSYEGVSYDVQKSLSSTIAPSRFGVPDERTVNIKFLAEEPTAITIDPKTSIFSSLKWACICALLAWLMYKRGIILTRALRIPEDEEL